MTRRGPIDPSDGDDALLRAFVAGDDAALGELARRHEAALLGLARGLLGGRRDAAMDAVQETWMRVIRYAKSFDGRASVKTWLYRITINRCRDQWKREARAAAREQRRAAPDGETSPAGQAEIIDDLAPLRENVGKLPPPLREAVLLCYHRDLTHAQAAEILGIPPGTLKSRLHAALTALRGRLASEVMR